MSPVHAVILSIVEGITEFLPVSSTGHLILTASLLGVNASDFVSSFEIFIQLGAIAAVAVLYARRLISDVRTMKNVAYAFIPTAGIGFVLYKIIKTYLLNNPYIVVASLAVGGVILIAMEKTFAKKPAGSWKSLDTISPKQAAAIGLFQSLSVIPGVSRAAATVIGAQITGLSREASVEFSFLLAVPTMAAATGLDLYKSRAFTFTPYEWGLMGIGFAVSFLVALVVIRSFLKYIKTNTFVPFGYYRIGIAFLYLFLIR